MRVFDDLTSMALMAIFALLVTAAGAVERTAPAKRTILVFNEDNSAYFTCSKYGGALNEQGYRDYVREIASGGRFTHFFMCPNAMCSNIPSKTMTTTWDAIARPGVRVQAWQYGVALMHAQRGAAGDAYAIWADECRRQGVSPWFSIRMNDVHCVDEPTNAMHSAFWLAHPEFRRVPHADGVKGGWNAAALDYAHPEVRAYMTAFIAEALAQYDVDGIELDWMRFTEHLTPGREKELSSCIDEVMKATRALADAAADRLGHPVLVGARVSSRPETARARGTDAVGWARARWIDWLTVGNFWAGVDFDLPYSRWAADVRAVNPNVLVLPSMDGGALVKGRRHALSLGEYSVFADRMYRQGAPGVYLFNLFDCPKENGVWRTIVAEGLPPDRVAERARGVTVSGEHD